MHWSLLFIQVVPDPCVQALTVQMSDVGSKEYRSWLSGYNLWVHA